MWWYASILLLLCVIPPVVMAQQEPLSIPDALPSQTVPNSQEVRTLLLWTDTIYDTMHGDYNTIHKMVFWCTDDILLYSIEIFVGGTIEHTIEKDSIRQNGQILEHDGYSGEGDIRLELVQGDAINLGSSPVVLSKPGSLMIPMQVSADSEVQIIATTTYAGGPNAECHLDSFNPGVVGAPFPLGQTLNEFGSIMLKSTEIGVDDFNGYLSDIGEDWQMELAIRDTLRLDISNIVDELGQLGASLYLGPPDGARLNELGRYNDDIVAISCCATLDSLSLEDNIFRTAPSDAYLGASLAHLMLHNDIQVILPVWVDDVWNNAYLKTIVGAFEEDGGIADEGIVQQGDQKLGELAPQIEQRIASLSERYGAGSVAVVMLPFFHIDFMQAMSEYPQANTVRWFGTDFLARDHSIIQDGKSKSLASNTGFTTLQLNGMGVQVEDVRQRLEMHTGKVATHDMLAAYESAWILGLAMQYAQSTDPQRLSEIIPHVAERYSGTLGVMRMDTNGDLVGVPLDVWSVHDGDWTRVGIME